MDVGSVRWILIITATLVAHGCASSNSPESPDRYKVNPTREPDSPNGIYIPKDLMDCFAELDKMLQPDFKREINAGTPTKFAYGHHQFGLGLWIRNNWGLWSGSRLAKCLERIGHPDGMSTRILVGYWRHLRSPAMTEAEHWLLMDIDLNYNDSSPDFQEKLLKDPAVRAAVEKYGLPPKE